MIMLTRYLSGERIAVNCDAIERVEETPDTVITITNGSKHVVQETIEQIAEQIRMEKATVLALAAKLADDPEFGRAASARLRVVRDAEDPSTEEGGPATDEARHGPHHGTGR